MNKNVGLDKRKSILESIKASTAGKPKDAISKYIAQEATASSRVLQKYKTESKLKEKLSLKVEIFQYMASFALLIEEVDDEEDNPWSSSVVSHSNSSKTGRRNKTALKQIGEFFKSVLSNCSTISHAPAN